MSVTEIDLNYGRKETLRCQREKDREEKSRITLNNYVMRIDVERLKTAETDDLINRMGGEERELIERLKRAQELQNQVSDLL